MAEQDALAVRVAHFTAFAALGVLSTTQELAGTCLASMTEADPELVAEETLCLAAVTTARAAEVGLRAEPGIAASIVPALVHLPFTYRDYLLGGAMIHQQNASLAERQAEIYQRLQQKSQFYGVHFPPNQFPGERALQEKMEFWMGRISPPGLPEMPAQRLEKLGLVPTLLTHLRLVLALGRQGATTHE